MPFTAKARTQHEESCQFNIRKEILLSGKDKTEVLKTLATIATELGSSLKSIYNGNYSSYSLLAIDQYNSKIEKLPVGFFVFNFMIQGSGFHDLTSAAYKYNEKTAHSSMPKQYLQYGETDFEYPANKSPTEVAVAAQLELLEITKKIINSAQLSPKPFIASVESKTNAPKREEKSHQKKMC